MNLVIQSNPSQELLWGVSRDVVFSTLVPTVITLVVFALGIWITRLRERSKENSNLDDLKVYFFTLTSSLPRPMSKLINDYEKLAKDILDEKPHNYFLPETHQLYLDNISKLRQENIFKALVSKSKDDAKNRSVQFKNLFDTFEYLRLQKERIRINFDYFMTDLSRYVDSWNNNMDLLEERFQSLKSLAKYNKISPADDTFLGRLDKIFFQAIQVEDYGNIFVAKIHLVDPIKDFCNEYSADPRVTMFMPLITKLRKAHDELKSMKELFGNSFLEEVKELEKVKKSFEAAIEYFNPPVS